MKRVLPVLGALLFLAPAAALANSASPISVEHAWARPTPQTATTEAVYLTIVNKGSTDDTLTAVSTPAAEKAELHATSNENGIMKMTPVPEEPVKAGGSLAIKPGGLHIMLTGLAHPLKAGDRFPLTLTFAKAGKIDVAVKVETKAPASKGDDMPGMKM